MRVAVVNFPISLEGGLATRGLHTVRLFRMFGHDTRFYRFVYSDGMHMHGNHEPRVTASSRGLHLDQAYLSITDKYIGETLDFLASFDLMIFLHAAPHLTDKQRAVSNWRALYTETRARKITYFSDQYAADLYPWIREVNDFFEPIGINSKAAEHASAVLGREVRTAPAPYVYDPIDPDVERENLVLWTSGWRRSKGVHRFVDAIPDIEAETLVFGVGRDRDAFEKTDGYARVCDSIVGAALPEEIEKVTRAARISCDFTGQSAKYHGHYNRATIEPMLLGCVSAVLPSMPSPNSPIPPEAVLVVDPHDVARSLNGLLREPQRWAEIAAAGSAWARSHFDPARTLQEILGSVAGQGE